MRSLVAVLCLLAAGAAATPRAVAAGQCERSCLSGFVTQYLAALAAHDPSRLPTARSVRFTENGVAIPLGEALWVTVSGIGQFRQDYVDTEAQQVAAIVSFFENGQPGLMSVRLKVVRGRITEIETVLNRSNAGAATLSPPDPLWETIEAPQTRLTRAQLVEGARGYLKAVASSNSAYVRFNEKSCIRYENSTVMALAPGDVAPGPLMRVSDPDSWAAAVARTIGIGCAKQLDTGLYAFITGGENARFPVVDVERQVVFGQWNFRRRGVAQGVTFEGKFYPFMSGMTFPNENLLGEAFKFRDGGITRVQGVFLNSNVYKAGTGWDEPRYR
jgi:hypothetical protein